MGGQNECSPDALLSVQDVVCLSDYGARREKGEDGALRFVVRDATRLPVKQSVDAYNTVIDDARNDMGKFRTKNAGSGGKKEFAGWDR